MAANKQSFKSFKLTIETLNPEFMRDRIAKREIYGSGYIAVITTGEDATVLASHGNNHRLRTVQSVVTAMDSIDTLSLLIAEATARLLEKGWGLNRIGLILKTGVKAARARGVRIKEEGKEAHVNG